MMSKTWQAATALSLAAAGAILCHCALKMPTVLSRLYIAAAGAGAVAIAVRVHKSSGIKGTDYQQAAQTLWQLFEQEQKQAGAVLVEFVPDAIQIFEKPKSDDWVARSNRRWMLIFARPEKGKTQVALQKMESFILANPNGYRLRLIDFDYGKRENTWGGYPKEAIVGAGPECENDALKLEMAETAIDEYYQEMIRRSKQAAQTEGGVPQNAFEPWFLGVDEGSSVIPLLPDESHRQIAELIRRGPGYNFSGFIIAQNPAVGELGLIEAVKSYLDKLCVRPDSITQIKEFALGSAEGQKLVDRALDAEKQGKRGAIWHSDYGTDFVYIPDRSDNPIQFVTPAQQTDGWLERIDIDYLKQAIADGKSKTEMWKVISTATELTGRDAKQSTKNAFYPRFLELLDQLQNQSEPAKPEIVEPTETVELDAELEAA